MDKNYKKTTHCYSCIRAKIITDLNNIYDLMFTVLLHVEDRCQIAVF